MLELSPAQVDALADADQARFIEAVADLFLADYPTPATPAQRATVVARMAEAHRFALDAGFTRTPDIVQLMFLATHAPQMCTDAPFAEHLRKPGATPEQRFADLLAIMKHQLKKAG